MLLIVGASATGKSELAAYLIKYYSFTKTITTTTRYPRLGEVDGKDYHFLSREQFSQKIKQGEFLEYATYNSASYGLQKKDIKMSGVVILEPSGANTLIDYLAPSDLFVVYIETSASIREKRMLKRGESKIDIQKRLALDNELFGIEKLNRVNLILINDQIDISILAKKISEEYIIFTK